MAAFYLYQLNGVGVLSTDEPRYAAIGQAMARTGDLVTPRLWGSPWFEKPPLLYWMTAAASTLGLGPEIAARLPVALLSLAFLLVAFILLRKEFGVDAATISVALLSTSAGWTAYSQLSLTDLPLAAFFSLAVLLALPLLRQPPPEAGVNLRFAAIGISLGMAMLAKGPLAVALFVPASWFLRKRWRAWWPAVIAAILVAGPWYAAVSLRNGRQFIEEFFWKQNFQRLYSASIQHSQPWYYYVPVLLGALFPWTLLLPLLARRSAAWDERQRFLLATVAFGFVVFSASVNKLPGYLVPLLPALFILLGVRFVTARTWLLVPALSIAAIPLVAHALPETLAAGRIAAFRLSGFSATEMFYVAAPLAALLLTRRSWLLPVLGLCVAASGIYLKTVAYPVLDQQVSARGLAREIPASASVCDGGIHRAWLYGLDFYRNVSIPPCGAGKFDIELRATGRDRPALKISSPSSAQK
jgi:4-amino-4-deoxy-L-arabinose transferase-like glycosyltransferase